MFAPETTNKKTNSVTTTNKHECEHVNTHSPTQSELFTITDFTTVTQSDTRFIETYLKEGNVLFNDALNTFDFTVIWGRTYGKEPLR